MLFFSFLSVSLNWELLAVNQIKLQEQEYRAESVLNWYTLTLATQQYMFLTTWKMKQ